MKNILVQGVCALLSMPIEMVVLATASMAGILTGADMVFYVSFVLFLVVGLRYIFSIYRQDGIFAVLPCIIGRKLIIQKGFCDGTNWSDEEREKEIAKSIGYLKEKKRDGKGKYIVVTNSFFAHQIKEARVKNFKRTCMCYGKQKISGAVVGNKRMKRHKLYLVTFEV